jgi:transcriptional regulator with XRE-family HTH domain
VAPSVGKAIAQSRQEKGLTQKDLGTKINEKPQVIAEYESGKAIPNPAILAKLEVSCACECIAALPLTRPTARTGREAARQGHWRTAGRPQEVLGALGSRVFLPSPVS